MEYEENVEVRLTMESVSQAYQLLTERQKYWLVRSNERISAYDFANAYGLVLQDLNEWLNGKGGLKDQVYTPKGN